MARKRMFDLEIINQDSFFDLPMDSKALYFLLGMEADDEGFVSPKKVLRLYGGTEDSLKVLIAKKYIIPFETGVIVITDWKRNNYLDKNKVKPTIYQEEKAQLLYDENSQKYISLTEVKPKLNQSLTKVNLEENSIEENSIEENNNTTTNNTIFDFLQENGFVLTPIQYDVVSQWEDNDLTRYAIKKAVLNNKFSVSYIDKILYSYQKENITTVQQAQENDEKFNKKRDNYYKNKYEVKETRQEREKRILEEMCKDEEE